MNRARIKFILKSVLDISRIPTTTFEFYFASCLVGEKLELSLCCHDPGYHTSSGYMLGFLSNIYGLATSKIRILIIHHDVICYTWICSNYWFYCLVLAPTLDPLLYHLIFALSRSFHFIFLCFFTMLIVLFNIGHLIQDNKSSLWHLVIRCEAIRHKKHAKI